MRRRMSAAVGATCALLVCALPPAAATPTAAPPTGTQDGADRTPNSGIFAVDAGPPARIMFSPARRVPARDVSATVDGAPRDVALRRLRTDRLAVGVVADTTLGEPDMATLRTALAEFVRGLPRRASVQLVDASGRSSGPPSPPNQALARLRTLRAGTDDDLRSAVSATRRRLEQSDRNMTLMVVAGTDLHRRLPSVSGRRLTNLTWLVDIGSDPAAPQLGQRATGTVIEVDNTGGVLAVLNDLNLRLRSLYRAEVAVDDPQTTTLTLQVGDSAPATLRLDPDSRRPSEAVAQPDTAERGDTPPAGNGRTGDEAAGSGRAGEEPARRIGEVPGDRTSAGPVGAMAIACAIVATIIAGAILVVAARKNSDSRREQARTRDVPVAATLLTIAAAGWWVATLSGLEMRDVGTLGFVSVAGPLYWAAWGTLVAALMLNLFVGRRSRLLLIAQTVAATAVLHGTVPIAEPMPRFATGWLHAGFADYIMRTGSTLPQMDARFEWPGFFAATAMVTTASGLDSPVALLRWTPPLLNLVYALLVYAIAAQASEDRRLRWVTVWVFLVGNWVGQDYLSPQGFAVLLFLGVLLILLAAFRGHPVPLSMLPGRRPFGLPAARSVRGPRIVARACDRLRRVVVADMSGLQPPQLPPRLVTALILMLTLVYGALVVTHQLTPVALIAGVAALVITRRCRLTVLPALMGVLFFGWISFGAVTYWAGHLSDIFGGVGALGSSLTANLGSRVGGSGERVTVLLVRLGLTGAVCGLAAIGVLRRSTRPRDASFALLAAAPFLVVAGNAYGGEALMRAYFYALPFVALYAASALMAPPATPPVMVAHHAGETVDSPVPPWSPATAPLLVAMTLIIAVVPFTTARYGNEGFEMVTPGERAAFDAFYAAAPAGADLVTVTTEVPARFREVESHHLIALEHTDTFTTATRSDRADSARAAAIVDVLVDAAQVQLDDDRNSLLVVSRGQDAYGQMTWALREGWTAQLVRDLVATGRVTVAFENDDAWLLRSAGAIARSATDHHSARVTGGAR